MCWISSAWCQCEDILCFCRCGVLATDVQSVVLAAGRPGVTSGHRSGVPRIMGEST